MSVILHVDAWKLGLLFIAVMLVVGWLGARTAPEVTAPDKSPNTRIADASIALFALLLAFSFSGAADRYEHRKGYLLDEAIAIGDFAATASMLDAPAKDEIRRELALYVKERITFGSVHLDAPEMKQVTARSRASQGRIQAIVRRIITAKDSPTLHTPLMNGFNGVTMTHDRALYGSQNQLSDTIIGLLVLFGCISAFLTGRFSGHAGRAASSFASMRWIMLYSLLVGAVFTVTMDLEQPHRGIMRNSKASLVDVLASLE